MENRLEHEKTSGKMLFLSIPLVHRWTQWRKKGILGALFSNPCVE